MKASSVLGLALLLAAAGGARMATAEGEAALNGTFKLSSGEADGKTLTQKQVTGGKLVMTGGHYTVAVPGRETVSGSLKTDPKKQPKTIDITDSAGPNKGKTCRGIYEVKGDVFHVVFAVPGKPRPTTMTGKTSKGQWKHDWQKVK